MGRSPCCDKAIVKRGPWSPEEDGKLKEYMNKYGTSGNWITLPAKAGLKRCGKSCRLRWLNYLRPNIKHGEFSDEEEKIICSLLASIGSRWSKIAAQLPGRTDNDIKNYWNTKLKKKLLGSSTTTKQQKINQTVVQQEQQHGSRPLIFSSPLQLGAILNTNPQSTQPINNPCIAYSNPSLISDLESSPVSEDLLTSGCSTTASIVNGGYMGHQYWEEEPSLIHFGFDRDIEEQYWTIFPAISGNNDS